MKLIYLISCKQYIFYFYLDSKSLFLLILPYCHSSMLLVQDTLYLNWFEVEKEDRRNLKRNQWQLIIYILHIFLLSHSQWGEHMIFLTHLCTSKLTQHGYLCIKQEELLCWIKTFGVFRPDWLTIFLFVIVKSCALVCKIITANCIT